MDLSRFQCDFLEEAGEHLAHMENLLLRIDPAAPAPEDIHAIFRAAHSIKGGSAMFGFVDTTAVTHELESLLDTIRKGERGLTSGTVDVLLEAADVLRAQLAFHAHSGPVPAAGSEAICTRIRACAATAGTAGTVAAPEAPAARQRRTLHVGFPAGELDEATLADLLAQLGELGTVELTPSTGQDAATRTLRLTTAESDEVVLTLFDFVMDARAVTIRVEAPFAPACAVLAMAMPAAASGASPSPSGLPRQESIRVSVDKVDQLINEVGELVITQAMLAQSIAELDPHRQAPLLARIADLQRNTRDLQESVMSIRMLPIASVFERFPRLARDLAAKLGKEVQVRIEGEHTELDKGLIEQVMDPLVHLVRNAVDHGIETTEARLAAGKPAAGTLRLSARHQGGSIVIEVGDDGGGLDRQRILAKARERGLSVHDAMADREVWNLIFEPGFSTAEVITDVSGRGVGMDVVKRNIGNLSGSIALESTHGAGTRVSIRLPLTLAIMDGLAVAVGEERYIVPLAGILESLQAAPGSLRPVARQGLVMEVRGEFLPVVFLSTLFGTPAPQNRAPAMVVVVEAEGTKVALAVDELLGQHQVVVKSLDAHYRRVAGLAGATIMGDGRVACILDLAAIVRDRRRLEYATLH